MGGNEIYACSKLTLIHPFLPLWEQIDGELPDIEGDCREGGGGAVAVF